MLLDELFLIALHQKIQEYTIYTPFQNFHTKFVSIFFAVILKAFKNENILRLSSS